MRKWTIRGADLVVAGVLSLALAVGAPAAGEAGTIETVAGNGNGDGGPATATSVRYPSDVAVDAAGNLFIAEAYDHRIRRVDASTGVISTVAGTGSAGFSGDGGPATKATLYFPFGVAVDSSGNLFIAEPHRYRVRRVDAETGLISTVAGNGSYDWYSAVDGELATDVGLAGLNSIAVDPEGNLFIAENSMTWGYDFYYETSRVRRVDASSGVITTVAGNGYDAYGNYQGDGGAATDAYLPFVSGIDVDAGGDLFLSVPYYGLLVRVDAETGVISTVSSSVYAAGGIAVDPSGDLAVADLYYSLVHEVSVATGELTAIAGNGSYGYGGDGGAATEASLSFPMAVAFDGDGNLFIADQADYRVRRVDAATGVITTVAGNGTLGDGGDGGPATSAGLRLPSDVAVDAAGNLFIADSDHHRIRRVDASTGVISTVAGDGTPAYDGDDGPATDAWLYIPNSLAFDTAGNLLIADTNNIRIRRIDADTGIISTVAGSGSWGFDGDGGPATEAAMTSPQGIAVDGLGNLYFSDSGNYRIRRVDADTGIITTVAGNGTEGYGGDGGQASEASFGLTYHLALDGAGNLLITDATNHRVRRVDASTGVITTVAGNGTKGFSGDGGPATEAAFDEPSGIDLDAAGNIFVTDYYNNRVRRIDAETGVVTTVAGDGAPAFAGDGGEASAASLNGPWGVAFDSAGNLFVGDWLNHRVRRINGIGEAANEPPSADAGPDQEVEAGSGGTASVQLDGTDSSDPDGDTLEFEWSGPFGIATGSTPTVSLGLGSSTVTLSVDDGMGETATDTVVVQVVDTTPPVLTAPATATLVTDCAGSALSVTPAMLGVSASDLCDTAPTLACSPTTLSPGVTTVDCTATDDFGNSAQSSISVTVLRGAFQCQFLDPLDASSDNKIKAGQTVPVKVRVSCGSTAETSATVTVDRVDLIDSTGSTTGNAVPEDSGLSNDGGNVFRLTGDDYKFNLSTKGWATASGTRFRVVVRVVKSGHVDTLCEVILKNK